jgi:hypothetical protein
MFTLLCCHAMQCNAMYVPTRMKSVFCNPHGSFYQRNCSAAASQLVLMPVSDRPKQEFSLSSETEYSAAKNHQIFGFGRIYGTFIYFRPKVNDLLHTRSKICQIRTTFDYGVPLPGFKHFHINDKQLTVTKTLLRSLGNKTICRRF